MIATTTDCQKLQDWRAKNPYCNFRLSMIVAIAQGQFLRAGRGRKPWFAVRIMSVCLSYSSRDMCISGFHDHIALSGCWSSSQSAGIRLRIFIQANPLILHPNVWGVPVGLDCWCCGSEERRRKANICVKWTKWMAEIIYSFDVCLSVCLSVFLFLCVQWNGQWVQFKMGVARVTWPPNLWALNANSSKTAKATYIKLDKPVSMDSPDMTH